MPHEMTYGQLMFSSLGCGAALAVLVFILLSRYAPHEVINHYEARSPKADPAGENA